MTARTPIPTQNRALAALRASLLASALALFLCLAPAAPTRAAEPVSPFPLEPVFSFGPDGTKATDFSRIESVGLDQQRDLVYVLEEGASEGILFRFGVNGEAKSFAGVNPDIEGNRIKGLDLEGYGYASRVAVDPASGVIYIVQPETESILALNTDGDPAEFTAGPGAGSSEIPNLGQVRAIAIDSNGSIYVTVGETNTVKIFAASGAPLTSFAAPNPRNIGVAPDGAVYVSQGGADLKRFAPASYPVSAGTTYLQTTFVDPSSPLVGLGVDPANGDVYLLESNLGTTWIRRYDGTGTLIESLGGPTETSAFGGASAHIAVWAEPKELSDGGVIKLYLRNWEVNNAPLQSKVAAVGRRIVKAPPEITKPSVLAVTADSARLRAWVDPNNVETTYRFEYGLSDCALNPCTEVPLGGASVGDGNDPVAVSQLIFDLHPATTYHYRVLAENSEGPAQGSGLSFTTQGLGLGSELIDSRAWEMVSPPDKGGSQLQGASSGLIQASTDGTGLAYLSRGATDVDPPGSRAPEFSAVLARRATDRWRSRDVSLPNDEVVPIGLKTEGEYKLYSPDLSRAVVMPRGSTLLSPQASERTPYLRQDGDPALFTPLLSGKEGFANVPPDTAFGGAESDTLGKVIPIGATSDLSHIVLRSELTAPLVTDIGPPYQGLYLWSAGQLHPISVLPALEGGSMAPLATFGSGETSVQHAISSDGSRVFWGASSALYLRDTLAEETTRIDRKQPGASGAGGATPVFQGASADGSAVFFADTRDLTTDASAGNGRDLYRCELPPESPTSGCATLTNISAPLAGSGESAEVLGMATGLSEDGTRIYFVAKGVLDEESNQYSESAISGNPNLYLWQEGEGVRFIVGLDEEDKGTWGLRGTVASEVEASKLAAAVSPGGRYLAFMSQRSLTGYANFDEATGEPAQQVYHYDALAATLDCVSCNPSGAAPQARFPVAASLTDPRGQYSGARVAAALPAAYANELRISLYRPRTTLDNGRVFFNAFDALVPADSNGEWDVYQWEPDGLGTCRSSSGDAATVRSAGGCLSLLSSGTAERESAFLDAGASGDDVFFLTPARLSVTDLDSELDVYDARVNGVPEKLAPLAECLGEACQPAAAPPSDPTPASTAFRGPGNPAPSTRSCPKGKRLVKRKGKSRCVSRKGKHAAKGRKSPKRGASR